MHKKQKNNITAKRNSVSPKQMENDSMIINGWYKHHAEMPNESKCVMSGWYQGSLQESTQHSLAKLHPHLLLTWILFVKCPFPYPIVWDVRYELPSREILGWEKRKSLLIDQLSWRHEWKKVMVIGLVEGISSIIGKEEIQPLTLAFLS